MAGASNLSLFFENRLSNSIIPMATVKRRETAAYHVPIHRENAIINNPVTGYKNHRRLLFKLTLLSKVPEHKKVF